jgi:diadenosine tetraphosphate (Ap4A) HIT family hydrolase
MVGVDDPTHYRANVAAYQRAAPRQRATQEVLKRVQADLDRRCEEGLNQPLLEFVKLAQSFHNETTPLGTYIRVLLSDAPKKTVGSSLVWFQEALELEGQLDFKQVERERGDLLGVLLRRLNAGDIEKLTQKSTAYRLGKIRYSEFYGDLRALCAENEVDLHRFPQMEMYIRYVLMADKIDPETLFTDLRALEGASLALRIKSPSEKRLVEETMVLGLAKKLAAFSLTTEEWNQYTSLSKDILIQEGLNLRDFEEFYREAQARDTAMADNVLREMKKNPSKPTVLVTGGFHSSGLTDRLTRAGVTVVRYTPRIEKINMAQGSAYLSVFSQEKTPLESLFQGQKLFLATSPANVEKFSFLAAITAAVKEQDPAARARIFADIYKETAGLLGFNNIKEVLPKIQLKDSADGKKTYVVQWKGKAYVVSFTNEKIVDFHPLPREDSMWRRVIAFLKWLAGKIIRWIPLKVVADRENGLPRVALTEAGTPGFAKERLLSAFHATRNTLIERGRPDGKPYFPYLYESRDREVVIESDGIKIVLVDVAERADYDQPRRLSKFARHPRDIREGHPDKCVFCRLLGSNSDEFFAQVQGTGQNVYRAIVNLGEYGYPHFQFISEEPVPNLYDRDNRFMDFLLSAQALGPEFGVMINGPFSGASQRHLHWHAIKLKAGGLWAYLNSLSPPERMETAVRDELSNYPGHPIFFRGTSIEELNKIVTEELVALYDQKISAGVHARVKKDGTFEVVVAPTRGEAMVSFDIVLNGSEEEFEKHRVAVRNYNLFGILDPSFDPIAEGMGATHTPGNYPNILMELKEGFRTNNDLQRRTAGRLINLFGDYNPTLFLPLSDRPLRAVGFFPSLASRKFYVGVPALYREGNLDVDRLYLEAAEVLNMYGPDGQPDPTQLSMQFLPAGEGKPGAIFRDFVLFNLALEIDFQSEARKREIPYKIEAYAGISAGLITAAVASGSLSIKDVAKLADYFWTNILQEARNAGEQVQYYTVNNIDPESYSRQIANSSLREIVDIYHFVSPSSVQAFVPVSQIHAFLEFNEKIPGVRLEPIRTPTYEYSHSPKLVLARQRLEEFLEENKIVFHNPKIPILSNNGGTLLKTASEVRTAILAIVNEPMKTEQTVRGLSSLNPDFLIEFGLGGRGKLILDLNKSEVPFQSWGVNKQDRDVIFSQMSKLLQERDSSSPPAVLAQTLLTKSVWKGVARLFSISPNNKYSKFLEYAFTALWEFFLHWVAPFFLVSWLSASVGLPLPDMWLIPVLAVILEPVFVGSHPFSAQGKELTRLAHFLMSFYGSGDF